MREGIVTRSTGAEGAWAPNPPPGFVELWKAAALWLLSVFVTLAGGWLTLSDKLVTSTVVREIAITEAAKVAAANPYLEDRKWLASQLQAQGTQLLDLQKTLNEVLRRLPAHAGKANEPTTSSPL